MLNVQHTSKQKQTPIIEGFDVLPTITPSKLLWKQKTLFVKILDVIKGILCSARNRYAILIVNVFLKSFVVHLRKNHYSPRKDSTL